jgi:transcriptional regulator with XRE-family HTH domain
MDIADTLRAWRATRGLSQPAAAAVLSVPVSTLRSWEQRREMPQHPGLVLLALGFIVEPVVLDPPHKKGGAGDRPPVC